MRARARKARDTQTEEGGTNETRREEPQPRPGDSSGFADSARAASHETASSSSERDSARGAFGEYVSSVQATLDAWEGTDLRNPELAGVGRRTRATRRARANGSTSGVASFLVEISQTKLLSKEEEVLLATNVQQQARVVAADGLKPVNYIALLMQPVRGNAGQGQLGHNAERTQPDTGHAKEFGALASIRVGKVENAQAGRNNLHARDHLVHRWQRRTRAVRRNLGPTSHLLLLDGRKIC